MNFQELKDMSEIERRHFLEAHAEEVREDQSYIYEFTEEEMEEMRKDFVKTSVEVQEIEEEKKNVLEAFKERLKNPKSTSKELLYKLTERMEKRRGNLYTLHDYDENRIYQVNEFGDVVSDRPLARGRQLSALAISKTGTDE